MPCGRVLAQSARPSPAESANPMRLASLALIVLGIIGLKLSTH